MTKLMAVNVGFTGTRHGMSIDQLVALRQRLSPGAGGTTWSMFSEFHHGDCIGADEEAHEMMLELVAANWPLSVDIVVHPPTNFSWRANVLEGKGIRILEPKPYLERDRDIVRACQVLIACPRTYTPEARSGTWYTIRMAKRLTRTVIIIYPDGTTSFEQGYFGQRDKEEMK